jgi:hypothetical protein
MMCLTPRRFTTSLLSLALVVGVSACTLKQTPQPEPITHAPLVVDEAMQLRQWNISVAHYQNGATVGTSTSFLLAHSPNAPRWTAALTDTPMFVVNSMASPVVLICSPPWQRVIYPSGGIEASYNAMPPLPGK